MSARFRGGGLRGGLFSDFGSPRFIVAALLLIVLLAIAAAGLAYLFSLRRYESVQVPAVEELDLAEAMLELQGKGLQPFVRLRYSSQLDQAGKIIDQSPAAGARVRVGRRVNLIVSRGVVLDRVSDWRGITVNELRQELASLLSGGEPLLTIGDIIYIFSDTPSGAIIQHDPPPGADIREAGQLDLVISRGPDTERILIPDLIGQDIWKGMEQLIEKNIPFIVKLDRSAETTGLITAQSPDGDTTVQLETVLQLSISAPADIPSGMVFGLFQQKLPDYPVLVEHQLEAIHPDQSRTPIVTIDHPGGRLTIPYLVPEGAILVLSRGSEELTRTPARSIVRRNRS